jgi:uncharacterized protein with beta-barrel porin domain
VSKVASGWRELARHRADRSERLALFFPRRLALAAIVLALSLAWQVDQAQAANQCLPLAVGAAPSGTTVNCNGTVTNQNSPDGYGTGLQDNDTINVQTGSVTGTNNGLNLDTDNTINLSAGTSITGGINGITTNSGTTTVNNTGGTVTGNGANSVVNAIVSPGSATVTNTGSITATSTAAGGSALAVNVSTAVNVTNTGGTITATANGGEAVGVQSNAVTLNNSGNITVLGGTGSGSLGVFGLNSTSVMNTGTISADDAGGAVEALGVASLGTLMVTNGASGTIQATGTTGVAVVGEGSSSTINNDGHLIGSFDGIFLTGPGTITNTGTITGPNAAIDVKSATGAVTINQNGGTITGAIKLSANADMLNIAGGAIDGNIIGKGTSDTINFALASGTFTYGSSFGFSGINQVNVNSGTVILNGTNSATNVDVNGGMLAGIGTVNSTVTVHSGGTFAPGAPGTPGTSMTIGGSLAFQSGALYLVQLNPAMSTFADVTGTASLAGTVMAQFAPGSYVVKQYTILQSASLGGTKFSALSTMNLPAGFSASLQYTGGNVLLDLNAILLSSGNLNGSLNQNQQNVANAIDNFFNNGGALPPNFLTLFGLTGGNLGNALTQLDGEVSTDARLAAFQLMDEFLGVMLDPFVYGRDGGNGGQAMSFAPEREGSFPPDIALAYASVLKAPPKPTFAQRWTAWGSAYGGSNTTDGNAVVGSNNVNVHTAGFAGGMDYRITPDSIVGFALAGGETHWGLAQGLGSGRSNAFQAGVYGRTFFGPAYVAAALAFANHDMSTNRIALGDQLTASFNGQSYGARIETGYRYGMPIFTVTPYGALQAQRFHTPTYSEADVTAGGFGLTFNAMNATDTRGELGARFDSLQSLGGMPLLLRARAAWAHDWIKDPALGAVFEVLPGANFVVNGAAPPPNSALTTVGAELHVTPALALLAKFDGDFGKGSQTYAGSGTVRYTW